MPLPPTNKRIALVHFCAGGTDGVSIEMEAMRKQLEALGHEVHLIVGDAGILAGHSNVHQNEVLSHRSDAAHYFQGVAFGQGGERNAAAAVEAFEQMKAESHQWLSVQLADIEPAAVIVNNLFSLPLNLGASAALRELLRDRQIPCMAICNDFYWEAERAARYPVDPNSSIGQVIAECIPPREENVDIYAINPLIQEALRERGIESGLICDADDFTHLRGDPDTFARGFGEKIGLLDSDIVAVQPTRTVARKDIKQAIRTVAEMRARFAAEQPDQPPRRAALVLLGPAGDETGSPYLEELKAEAERLDVTLIEAYKHVGHARNEDKGRYGWDDALAYFEARLRHELITEGMARTFYTYYSTLEGFGNNRLEIERGRRIAPPVAGRRYPVRAWLDKAGFVDDLIGPDSPADPKELKEHYDRLFTLLHHPKAIKDRSRRNSEASRQFDLSVLEHVLEEWLIWVGVREQEHAMEWVGAQGLPESKRTELKVRQTRVWERESQGNGQDRM